MDPLFLGSHSAIDFLNTALAPNGEQLEMIGDGNAWIRWLMGAGLLADAAATRIQRRFSRKALDLSAAEARQVREWARAWLDRWRTSPNADYSREVETLNKLLARESLHRRVVTTSEGMSVIECSDIDSSDMLLVPIANSFATLITMEEPSLVKHCAGTDCTLWFLDRTKGHRRLFCSTSVCGNRAKVAAFRERQRLT